jgi:hypothetical protein
LDCCRNHIVSFKAIRRMGRKKLTIYCHFLSCRLLLLLVVSAILLLLVVVAELLQHIS